MQQIPMDDIVFTFSDEHVEFEVRVASRHGRDTAPALVKRIRSLLRDGCKVSAHVEVSRFRPARIPV